MSPEVERLHVAARRYCADRFEVWTKEYQRLVAAGGDRRGPDYTPEAYRTFPRYQVLDAIRTDLERLTGADVVSLDDAREMFALAGLTAENAFTSYDEPQAQAAVLAEREEFARFVREVPNAILSAVEPLPYTRVLSPDEAEQVWGSVERVWGLRRREYWYPLAETERSDVERSKRRTSSAPSPPNAWAFYWRNGASHASGSFGNMDLSTSSTLQPLSRTTTERKDSGRRMLATGSSTLRTRPRSRSAAGCLPR